MLDVATVADDADSLHSVPSCDNKPRDVLSATTVTSEHMQLGVWAHWKAQLPARRATMPVWVLHEADASAGKSTYLRCGQLEVMQAQHHMYDTVWSGLPAASNSSSVRQAVEEMRGTMVWSPGSTYPNQLDTECGSCSVLVLGLDELCAVQGTTLVCRLHTGPSIPGSILQAVQTAGTGWVSVWVLGHATCDQSSTCCSVGVWGLAKSVNAERGELLHCVWTGDHAACSFEPTSLHASETQLVACEDARHQGIRLVATSKARAAGCPVELALNGRGALSSLSVQLQTSQPGTVLQVKAVGLNFRDVLNVLGMYPGDPGPPGGDCAGVACVEDQKWLGAAVLGLGFGSLRSHATTDLRLLAAMPPQWSYEESSAMPTVLVTVCLCLEELAGTCSDCNVLAQAATGGVGLVAIEYARHAGARVWGTAGSVTKRAYVQRAGVSTVSTTRESTLFVAEMQSILGSFPLGSPRETAVISIAFLDLRATDAYRGRDVL